MDGIVVYALRNETGAHIHLLSIQQFHIFVSAIKRRILFCSSEFRREVKIVVEQRSVHHHHHHHQHLGEREFRILI